MDLFVIYLFVEGVFLKKNNLKKILNLTVKKSMRVNSETLVVTFQHLDLDFQPGWLGICQIRKS